MGAESHTSKWGTGLAVRIPKPIAEQWGDQVVLRKKSYDLVGMLAQMSPDNLHSEQDSGQAQGNEEG